MAKTITIVFFMSIVVVGSLQFSKAHMTAERDAEIEKKSNILFNEISNLEPQYKACVETCKKTCTTKGVANDLCDPICDKDCMKNEVVGIVFNLWRNGFFFFLLYQDNS